MPTAHAIISGMILVTGGTGFIGRALIRHLVDNGYQVRTLIRPSKTSPRLPKGVPVEVAVASFNDERGLRAAMVGVDTVYHLAGVERRGVSADLLENDIQGTRAVVSAAVEAGVDRFFAISHLGADRSSAYPVLKAKAIAEEHIRRSGIDYTILRTAIVFGPGDGFTTGLAQLLHGLPFIFLLPRGGETLIQPLWIEDLVTCMTWALDDDDTRKQVYDIGGPEFLSLHQVVEIVMSTVGVQRVLLSAHPVFLRVLTVILEAALPTFPVSVYWLDYFATNRTCSLDTVPRVFNLIPARLNQRLAYLESGNWGREFRRSIFRRRK
jgi:NADH dehydrogenase